MVEICTYFRFDEPFDFTYLEAKDTSHKQKKKTSCLHFAFALLCLRMLYACHEQCTVELEKQEFINES